jgi:hypothetical protein
MSGLMPDEDVRSVMATMVREWLPDISVSQDKSKLPEVDSDQLELRIGAIGIFSTKVIVQDQALFEEEIFFTCLRRVLDHLQTLVVQTLASSSMSLKRGNFNAAADSLAVTQILLGQQGLAAILNQVPKGASKDVSQSWKGVITTALRSLVPVFQHCQEVGHASPPPDLVNAIKAVFSSCKLVMTSLEATLESMEWARRPGAAPSA